MSAPGMVGQSRAVADRRGLARVRAAVAAAGAAVLGTSPLTAKEGGASCRPQLSSRPGRC
jgi:hypothetical protein